MTIRPLIAATLMGFALVSLARAEEKTIVGVAAGNGKYSCTGISITHGTLLANAVCTASAISPGRVT